MRPLLRLAIERAALIIGYTTLGAALGFFFLFVLLQILANG